MTLNESTSAFLALKKEGLVWPRSSILLKDPSLSRYAEVYAQVKGSFLLLLLHD